MFGNLGLHLEHFPSGKYGYVGSIPIALCRELEATTADIMGNRTHRDQYGNIMVWKPPVFDTAKEAYNHAINAGAKLCQSETCACAKIRKEII